MGYTEKEIKSQIKECFFENFIFKAYRNDINNAWVDGALSIVVDIFNNGKSDLTISELVEFFNIEGDFNKLSTYEKIENELKNIKNPRFFPIEAEKTKLGYFSMLAEIFKLYFQHRNKILEEVFELFVNEQINVNTLNYASINLNNGKFNTDVCIKVSEILKDEDVSKLEDVDEKNMKVRLKIRKLI